MTKHADRIWRTVVFAGAMLGAPLVSADTPKKDAKPAAPKPAPPPKVDTVASVQKELDDLSKKISITSDALVGAQNDADRQAAKARLESQKKTKADLEKRLAELKAAANAGKKPPPPAPETPITRLEKELKEIDNKIAAAVDAVAAAQNDADRAAAKMKLTMLQKDKADTEKKLAAERKAAQRPRTPESDKPIGRGFVLA